jgi:hypothetical protein
METSKFMVAVGSALPILLAACSAATTERTPNSDSPYADNSGNTSEVENAARPKAVATLASSSTRPVVAAVSSEKPTKTVNVVRVPEDVLRSPVALMTLMQQMRSQIVYKTNKIPEAEYEEVVRPSLVSQLNAAGFAPVDVDEILSDVDYSRTIQGLR